MQAEDIMTQHVWDPVNVCAITADLSCIGLRAEEDLSGASGDHPFVNPTRGLGKRPSSRWTKLGSDAESPPGKRAKTQVPGVKAANGEAVRLGLVSMQGFAGQPLLTCWQFDSKFGLWIKSHSL